MSNASCEPCAQVTDTPGLLNRSNAERNVMENLTLACLEHLPCTVVFVTDLTAQCGTSVADQLAIRRELLGRFPGMAWLDVLSKADLLPGVVEQLQAEAAASEAESAPEEPAEPADAALVQAAAGRRESAAEAAGAELACAEVARAAASVMESEGSVGLGSAASTSGPHDEGSCTEPSSAARPDPALIGSSAVSPVSGSGGSSSADDGAQASAAQCRPAGLHGLEGLLASAQRISCTQAVGLDELKLAVLGVLH